MKKSFKLVMLCVLAFGSLLVFNPKDKAEAATSSWKTVSGFGSGCQVRVVTDSGTYYSGASTIDAYAQTNGKCGTLSYTTWIEYPRDGGAASKETYSGSFSSKTSTRKFSLSYIRGSMEKNSSQRLYVYFFFDKGSKSFNDNVGVTIYK
ncbi:cell wall-binding protein [Priestia aryabhattai]|uniref:cell wall-binding protein n=1 Tax=Priestia TaxID=2800373 RepID=UPI000D3E870E|nr:MULTISPECIES: cell wall-binding protein [Priestia]AWD68605.1 cell wall-binding protein [Priestia megaterium]MDC7767314.1 cell wall-binding protein [Priestia aryabhattai]MED3821412.1 cell wall-binding protein [Priestia aryabhattai]UPK52857.1 cell wall-binding protein [Bacillus sp. H8-1]